MHVSHTPVVAEVFACIFRKREGGIDYCAVVKRAGSLCRLEGCCASERSVLVLILTVKLPFGSDALFSRFTVATPVRRCGQFVCRLMETPAIILHEAFSRLAAVCGAEDKLDAIRFLIFVCGSCPIAKFLKIGLDALVGLSKADTAGKQIVEQGAVLKLVQLLGKSNDTEVLGKASEALCNLATHEASRSTMIEEGAVRFLVHTCTTLQNETALEHSALALSHMAMDAASRSWCS